MQNILTLYSFTRSGWRIVALPPATAVGTGNGQLLFAFSAAGYTSLTGIDYSPLSIELANDILKARSAPESEHTIADPPPRFFVADILQVALGEKVQGVSGRDVGSHHGQGDVRCCVLERRAERGQEPARAVRRVDRATAAKGRHLPHHVV